MRLTLHDNFPVVSRKDINGVPQANGFTKEKK